YVYTGGAGFHPQYTTSGYAFFYSAPNHTLDARIKDVITPSNADIHKRQNPICNQPKIVVQNTGTTPITSLTISYGAQGMNPAFYTWTGFLPFLESTEILLPAVPLLGDSVFVVSVNNPNGGIDQYEWNNTFRTKYKPVPVLPIQLRLLTRTNFAPLETKYELTNAAGVVLYENRPNMVVNTMYNDTFLLNPGECYQLRIWDTDEDGLSFFANNDGNGYMRLHDLGTNQTILTFEKNFGGELIYNFRTQSAVSNESSYQPFVDVFPNPTDNLLFLYLNFPQVTNVYYRLFNSTGMELLNNEIWLDSEKQVEIPVSGYPSGIYFLQIQSGNFRQTKKILIE
ncbi:MAG: T9SS type A sorting domain-containing protein, partial [Bacteroidia bacterium]|nr:T9SS type A sorting domain-containing protein [Bacteroidia bacterium]